jgi:nitrate/nitrite-specific signal transduction histidine kinase
MAERARIARELHDVVAHRVSMIAVQAETARLTTEGLSAEGKERLRTIGNTAREAMAEMRTLLDLLRSGDTAPDFAPQPGLHLLDKLVEEARRSGAQGAARGARRAPTPAKADGPVRIPDPAGGADQRAPPRPGRRHHRRGGVCAELVRMRVADDGPGAGPVGQGLLSMRERATMAGGTLRVGPRADGGFAVEAELPAPRGPTGVRTG